MMMVIPFGTSQDRIGRDGNLISGNLPARHAPPQEHSKRPPSLPPTAPLLPPISDHQLQDLVDFVTGNRCCTIAPPLHKSAALFLLHMLLFPESDWLPCSTKDEELCVWDSAGSNCAALSTAQLAALVTCTCLLIKQRHLHLFMI